MVRWRQDLLVEAQKNKKDEFYTQICDVEAELKYYSDAFYGKDVFLNCDDANDSAFLRYFLMNFDRLQLNSLVATSYRSAVRPLKDGEIGAIAKRFYRDAVTGEVKCAKRRLKGDGDFRSAESLELLRCSDIVVTNPPFSLFREFVSLLVSHNKKFLILGNMTASTSKVIFPLFMEDKVWYGKSIRSGDREFAVPSDYPLKASGYRVGEDGNRYIRVKGVRWFTNIEYSGRFEDYQFREQYNEGNYPQYVNFDAIDVSRSALIPADYSGLMGVPLSYLDKHNPRQFEIVGSSRTLSKPMSEFAEKGSFSPGGPRFYLPNGDGTYKRLFERIVIRNKYL